MYRMPTGLAPYASHPDMPQFHDQVRKCEQELADVGRIAIDRGIRLSTHPGQYTVLNSDKPDVQAAAVAELEVQAALLDAMGLGPEAVVVLHVGGLAGGIDAALDRFPHGFEQLSDRARARLVIENDDRIFGLVDVLELSERTGLRIVWDVLHHRCHDPARLSDREALALAPDTWPQHETPKIHFSSPRLDVEERKVRVGRRTETKIVLPQLRAHADLIDPIGFEAFLRDAPAGRDFDVMLEAKAKDLALLRLRSSSPNAASPARAAASSCRSDGRVGSCRSLCHSPRTRLFQLDRTEPHCATSPRAAPRGATLRTSGSAATTRAPSPGRCRRGSGSPSRSRARHRHRHRS